MHDLDAGSLVSEPSGPPSMADWPGRAAPERLIAWAIARLAGRLIAEAPGRLHREVLALVERPLLQHVLSVTGGNQLRAARLLGLNRNTLRKRCRELELLPPRRPRSSASAGTPASTVP